MVKYTSQAGGGGRVQEETRKNIMKYIAYVGHQTDDKNEGIRILEADAETGRFRQRRLLHVPNAIYMAINRAKTRLYTSFSDPAFGPRGKSGGLAAYAIKGDDLVKINALGTGASTPCHVSLAPDEKALVYAEYGGATAGFVELADDGALKGPAVQTCITDPAGPNKPRQDKPHAHCAIVSPDSKNLCVVDLGVDQVKVYDWADRANGLKEIPSRTIHTTPAGAGPRHILFHPNGKLAFVIFELENYVTSYRYDGESFRPVQQLPLLPAGFTEFSKAAAIKLSEDGKQLFCSNRGHDSIAVFAVDPDTGLIALLNIMKLGGAFPRDFEFFPGGKFLLAGLKMSGILRSYAYNSSKCTLEPVMDMAGLYRPLFIKFGNPA